MHGKIAKKNCQKALDILTEEGQLQAKEFGKNKVWLLNQQNIPQVNAQELAALTEKLNSVKKEHDKLADEVKELNAYLKNLQNQLTNEALSDEIAKYKKLVIPKYFSSSHISTPSSRKVIKSFLNLKVEIILKFQMKT